VFYIQAFESARIGVLYNIECGRKNAMRLKQKIRLIPQGKNSNNRRKQWKFLFEIC
jgi:hypothetical protein